MKPCNPTWRVIEGDCIEQMRELDEASVDAIVTDPPYGLEFMGKDWDRLDAGLPQENVWKGRHGKGGSSVGEDDTKPASRHHVALGANRSRFRRCTTCGRRQFSGNPCDCAEPMWLYETPEGPPSGMVRMQRWHHAWALEALRVLKPGAHLLAFGGTRTYHRLACALEDAGFEIRDCLAWLYGSGFPKSLDVSKSLDKAAGAEREVPGRRVVPDPKFSSPMFAAYADGVTHNHEVDVTTPATPDAECWQGWGTALKPAFEPIILARKPLSERTVAANVLRWGTGALNIDGTRIPVDPDDPVNTAVYHNKPNNIYGQYADKRDGVLSPMKPPEAGRWPANVVLDEEAAAMLDEQTGETTGSNRLHPGREASTAFGQIVSSARAVGYADTGGASRFFYTAKTSRAEREVGRMYGAERNNHPTVKPVDLMQWLCRLVTPPGGAVLDPFMGSGSTGMAALREGFSFIGIEREVEYVEIARARIEGDAPMFNISAGDVVARTDAPETEPPAELFG